MARVGRPWAAALAVELERDFELLGATASEDKLQDGVPQCARAPVQHGDLGPSPARGGGVEGDAPPWGMPRV